jgi:hypothetical protein
MDVSYSSIGLGEAFVYDWHAVEKGVCSFSILEEVQSATAGGLPELEQNG